MLPAEEVWVAMHIYGDITLLSIHWIGHHVKAKALSLGVKGSSWVVSRIKVIPASKICRFNTCKVWWTHKYERERESYDTIMG